MFHFSRKAEYALIAIGHMGRKEGQNNPLTSARELAESYHLPYPLLAKVMQKLGTRGIAKAVHGTKGGYILAKPVSDITVADVVEIFDGSLAVADCFREEKITCPQWDGCSIKNPLYEINHKIQNLLASTTVSDLIHPMEGNTYPALAEIQMAGEKSL